MVKPPPVRRALSLLDIRKPSAICQHGKSMERSVVSEMPLCYRADKLPTSCLSCERDKQRQQPTRAGIWCRLVATDGLCLCRQAHLASAMAAASRPKPAPRMTTCGLRDCEISKLDTLLWRCQKSGLAGQVRAIYCIYVLAQC